MSPSILTQMPDLGLNALVPESNLDLREAVKSSQNIFYEYGVCKTPFGFSKLDLSTGLNSTDIVLAVFRFTEPDNYSHLMAVTTEKIYEHDRVNNDWDDRSQSGVTYTSDIHHPVSYAQIAHDDTTIYIDDDSGKAHAYYHLVVCDGGLTNIQRWAGRYEADFGDLVGADGYHDGTTHRALHVGEFRSRLILLNPREYNSSSKVWVQNNQRIRYPQVSKLESWTGTGSGFADLIDTGGHNLWADKLGAEYIIYQNNSIWGLNYVGGSKVFDPRVHIPNLGLLDSHLIIAKNNIHYFVGNDYNIYAYYGASVKEKIGDKIHKFLQEDLDTDYQYKCRMAFGPENKRIWIFIVPSGSVFARKAYILDVRNGSWQVRDFEHVFGSSSGITAVTLAGAASYIVGDTYAEALNTLSSYDSADDTATTAGDTTQRYGDALYDNTGQLIDWSTVDETLDFTQVAFSAGGLFFCFTTPSGDATALVGDDTDYSNLIMRIDDGSYSSDMPNGSHYYTLTDVSIEADAAGVSCKVNIAPCESTGTAAADTSSDTPVLSADTTARIFDPSGATYRQVLDEIRVKERMTIADDSGFVYQFDASVSTDDGNDIVARHRTPVIDLGQPDRYKRWEKVSLNAAAEMTCDGAVQVNYRLASFDTSDTGWSDDTHDVHEVTVDFSEFDVFINRSSKQLQLELRDWSGSNFQVKSYQIYAEILDNR